MTARPQRLLQPEPAAPIKSEKMRAPRSDKKNKKQSLDAYLPPELQGKEVSQTLIPQIVRDAKLMTAIEAADCNFPVTAERAIPAMRRGHEPNPLGIAHCFKMYSCPYPNWAILRGLASVVDYGNKLR